MKKVALLLMLVTIISKVLGFFRDITLSYFYGVSNVSDAYLISLTIPIVIFGFVGAGLAASYIPMYNRITKEVSNKRGVGFTSNLINILLILCTITVAITMSCTEFIVKFFASGFDTQTMNIAVQFTKINIISIYFTVVVSVFSSFLHVKGRYLITALIGFPMNIIIILAIIISNDNNVLILIVGSVIGAFSQLLIMLPSLYKSGYRHTFKVNYKDIYIKRITVAALPVMLGVSINEINTLVDRTLASQIVEGGISALNYAVKLNGFLLGIFVLTIVTVIFPVISKMAINNDQKNLKKVIYQSINSVNLLVAPAALIAMVFTEPIITILYGRGEFDVEAIILTSNAWFFYAIGLIGFGLREILAKVFFALNDTKTPMINASIAMVINVILNIILSKYLGIGGLALATSISAVVSSLLLFINLRIKIGSFNTKYILLTFAKILISSVIMISSSKLTYEFLLENFSSITSLSVAIILGVVIYLVSVLLMKVEEVKMISEEIKQKIIRK